MGIPGGYPGWVYGWVGGRGYTGTQPHCSRRVQIPAERAPEAPARGLEWVGIWSRTYRGLGGSRTTPAGPGRSLRALPVLDPWNARSWPIRRDFTTFPVKLVKTGKCHLNSSIRPVIVPIFKTASKSRLLIFSDFYICQPSLPRN